MGNTPSRPSPSRRTFLAGSLTTSMATAAALKPSVSARSASRVLGANDRINVAHIGVGGNGSGNLRSFVGQSEEKKDIQIVAVCDVYTRRKENAREMAKLETKDVHHDYRDLLARPDVDGVFISTPDHWHAQMAIDAMTAGKDVYLQKPMTYTIDEARNVWETATRLKRVLQVGSQHLSDVRCHRAREIIQNGEIGELLWAQTSYSRNSKEGEWNYYVDEEGNAQTIDWQRWLGSAPKRAFSAERYFRWRKYWDYSGGIATDLFYHRLGPILYAMGAQFPTRVTASGGIYVQKDREVPDTYATTIEYPNFYINIASSMANSAANNYHGEAIYGHKGSIIFDKDKIIVVPEPLFAENKAGRARGTSKGREVEAVSGVVNRLHTDNWLACMRSREQPILNPDLGYKIMTAIRLGVDSYREGKVKYFDPRTQKAADRGAQRPGYEGDGKNPADSRYKKKG